MRKQTGRRSRGMNVVLGGVLVAAVAAWAGGSPLAAGAAEPVPMCFGMPATIIGTADDDVLSGTAGDDVIVGLEGTDVIHAGGGTDRVCAGPNARRLNADGVPLYERVTGGSYVDGGPGLDWLEDGGRMFGGSNPTVVDEQGRLWPERIVMHNGGGEFFGGDGPDQIEIGLVAEVGRATIDAGAGHDVVTCFGEDIGERCEVSGGRGTGNDRLRAVGIFTIKMFGGSGNDVLSAKEYGIELDGGPGDDALYSNGDRQTLRGGSGSDRLATNSYVGAGTGPHILQGGTGDDHFVGDETAERFGGGAGTDTVRAGGGNDTAWGGTGYDVLVGASGRDSLFGEEGNDSNYGGPGSDLCRSPSNGPRAHSCER